MTEINLPQAEELQTLSEQVLAQAKQQGADAAEVDIDFDIGLSVTARMGEVETIEHLRNRGIAITVYFGKHKGNASTSLFTTEHISRAVTAACDIARYTSEDPCTGLAPIELMAKEFPALDLYHPWVLTAEQAIDLAIETENFAREYDSHIVNSEGASVNWHEGIGLYANTHGFVGIEKATQHSISCVVIGQDEQGMQRDYAYSVACDPKELHSPQWIGQQSADKTLRRLGAQKLHTMTVPVIFIPEIARGFWRTIVSALSGGALYRKTTFLVDSLDKVIFPEWLTITEHPHLTKQLGSASFDSEGVATKTNDLIKNGRVATYLLGSYSACKLQMQTTGHAGGVHNLQIIGENSLSSLLKQMDKGLLVTELLGQGVNLVTGDYSRGAAGFWVENGEIQYPVEEITIAGNLKNICKEMIAIGSDIDYRGSIHSGSLLLNDMTIAGN